ncbi:MAG: peptidylprolyl isomerase [Pirellula sp.]
MNNMNWLPSILILVCIATMGCQPESNSITMPNGEPKFITVQHCLIAFEDTLGDKILPRKKDQAGVLAQKLFEQAKAGEDFSAIVQKYTDDSPPGIYRMVNRGVTEAGKGAFARGEMVPAFGDIGFALQVGEYGLAEYS